MPGTAKAPTLRPMAASSIHTIGRVALCAVFASEVLTAQLKQHQGQQKTSIGAVMTVTAANRISQHSQVLEVAKAQAGETEFRRVTVGANHGTITIRGRGREIQSPPPEGLLPPVPFRCRVALTVFVQE
jgi:hypothetical protein